MAAMLDSVTEFAAENHGSQSLIKHCMKSPSSRLSERSIVKYRPPMSRKLTRTDSCCSTKTPFGMRKVNQYILIEKLGVGAYGDVFKVIEPST